MADGITQQIVAIHSMLSAGHRNLRIERHTLILWGLAGGGLALFSERILTPSQFPDPAQRALAWLVLLTGVLGGVAALDWRLTRRAKRVRDEAWSFIHRQVLKVWWLLMGLGTLMTFAVFFFGGGYMVFAAWIILVGLGLYVHGLFSEELLEWAGVLSIAIGIATLAYRLDPDTMRLIMASHMGLGLPMLALMLDGGHARPSWRRMGQAAVWMAAVLAAPLAVHLWGGSAAHDAPILPLDAFRRGADAGGRRILTIPAGTPVPVELAVAGNVFAPATGHILPLTLATALEVAMEDGQPTGEVRFAGENWSPAGGALWLAIPLTRADVTPEAGPRLRAVLDLETMGAKRR
ncbi:MAG TPA: hypothetical protein VD995_33940 [Azospirillum sp.]|nr:hypothetical protein [Azospirillum sp.]